MKPSLHPAKDQRPLFNFGSVSFLHRPPGTQRMGIRLLRFRRAASISHVALVRDAENFRLGVHWPSLDFVLKHDHQPGPACLPLEKNVDEIRAFRAALKLEHDWMNIPIKIGSISQLAERLPRRILFHRLNGDPAFVRRRFAWGERIPRKLP